MKSWKAVEQSLTTFRGCEKKYFVKLITCRAQFFLISIKQILGYWKQITGYTPYSKMAAILVFFCLIANWPFWPRSRLDFLLNFTFESEAKRDNLQGK